MFLKGLSMLLTIAKFLSPKSIPTLSSLNFGFMFSTSTPTDIYQ